MSRKLLIFGNGLGMAVDPAHFSLTNALKDIWNRDDVLNASQKELISRCTCRIDAPESEDELDKLHLAITSCNTLNKIGEGSVHWLTEDGQSFPDATARYIHEVATKLHDYNGVLPSEFIDSLVDFVKKTKSHVATLNYDKLLYTSFIDNDVFNGYRGYLVDGMLDAGFDSDNLVRQYDNDFGYYLHLHGSPLFIDRERSTYKLSRNSLVPDGTSVGRHIVLTHVKHKPSVIAASEALSAYWDFLKFSISEIEEIILFGYSGLDIHLNHLIKPYLKNKKIRIVEWEGAGQEDERHVFWQGELGVEPELIRLDSVLKFTDW